MAVADAGSSIKLTDAADLTEEYRTQNPGATKAHLVGKNNVNDILDQEDCEGIRIYYGLTSTGDKRLVLVGVDAEGDDMVNGVLIDKLDLCPTICSTSNDLNS